VIQTHDSNGFPVSEEVNLLTKHGLLDDVIRLAKASAVQFHDEFPGEALDPAATEWDSTAWEVDRAELDSDALAKACDEHDGVDPAWTVYSETLYAEVDRLNEGA
jgi:hypothetical protein